MKILEKFINYVKFDTQSEENSTTQPSTLKQKDLGNFLVNELKSMGITNAFMDNDGYVYANIPSNVGSPKSIGLIAHMDTATEVTGANVKPMIIDNYNGQDIILPNNLILSPNQYETLNKAINHTLVTTDGTTLLGGDDKAGIAIIMETIEQILTNNYPHPNIYIAFTPDEEIGEGATYFNYDYFKVDFAYTIDGAEIDTIAYENFNAASATVEITGYNIHPGDAKNKMINSSLLAMEFNNYLPSSATPANTELYEGFYHLNEISGDVSNTKMHYLIRNHDAIEFENQKQLMKSIEEFMNKKYPSKPIKVTITDSYQNMASLVLTKPESLELPKKAMKMENIEAHSTPIRGGTDGARLTYEGIICPNLGTGSYNHHGVLEYADITEMEQMVKVIIKMFEISVK
ncbi:MAG: peptidase T [Bacilli bacterium]|nr:peptidase T [Bacilli bacterium]